VYVPLYSEILSAILDTWVTFVILVLIFAIGCRKRDGLWTTQQPPNAVFVAAAQPQQGFQQAWPAPQYTAPQGGGVQYYPEGAPPQQQMQSGWQQQQQQAQYYEKSGQNQPAYQSVDIPEVSAHNY
jgi:hypothetical protein